MIVEIETDVWKAARMGYVQLVIELDDVDRRMIDLLRADGRLTAPALADRIGVGRATAYSRFDRLVERGVIDGFSARVDLAAVGLTLSALVLVNVRQGMWRDLQAQLTALPGVEWLGVATGRFDFVLLVRADSLEHLRDVALHELQQVEGVRSAETIVLLDETDQRSRPIWATPRRRRPTEPNR
jgi:Lrp/AsnC family transcriptional regulator, leucine-responsive regulatory protein